MPAEAQTVDPDDRLARALTMLGRIVKTTYILRYLHDAAIRDRVQLQLNRGESRHELARNLFFANQGSFRTGDGQGARRQGPPGAHLSPGPRPRHPERHLPLRQGRRLTPQLASVSMIELEVENRGGGHHGK